MRSISRQGHTFSLRCLPCSEPGYYSGVVSRNAATIGPRRLRAVPGGGEPQKPISDEQLIEAVQRGDGAAASQIYDLLIDVVDRTLYKVFGRRETDHDDLVQMAFEQIVITLSRRSFARACSLRTWASTVTSHVGLNALRSRQRERRWVDRRVDAAIESERRPLLQDAERSLEARSRLESIRQHLAAMSPAQAETVFLHDALGHELAEISVITGVSVAAAQSRLVRGRKELFKRLDRERKTLERRGE